VKIHFHTVSPASRAKSCIISAAPQHPGLQGGYTACRAAQGNNRHTHAAWFMQHNGITVVWGQVVVRLKLSLSSSETLVLSQKLG